MAQSWTRYQYSLQSQLPLEQQYGIALGGLDEEPQDFQQQPSQAQSSTYSELLPMTQHPQLLPGSFPSDQPHPARTASHGHDNPNLGASAYPRQSNSFSPPQRESYHTAPYLPDLSYFTGPGSASYSNSGSNFVGLQAPNVQPSPVNRPNDTGRTLPTFGSSPTTNLSSFPELQNAISESFPLPQHPYFPIADDGPASTSSAHQRMPSIKRQRASDDPSGGADVDGDQANPRKP